MPRHLGQIDVAKTEAILDAASEVFAERGLAAPIDAVARRASVARQTIYNHYGCKEQLVRALVERRVGAITAPLRAARAEAEPEAALAGYARVMLEAVGSIERLSLMRVTIQSASEMPDLARTFYDAGPLGARQALAAFLRLETALGRLDVGDALQAAEIFSGMVIGGFQIAALLGVERELTAPMIDALARETAARFMRAYAP